MCISKPVLVQGPFLLHRSVYSPRFQATQSYEITICKYTVLVAILVLHRGIQAIVSALFFVSPTIQCKSLIVMFLVIFRLRAWPRNCMNHKSLKPHYN